LFCGYQNGRETHTKISKLEDPKKFLAKQKISKNKKELNCHTSTAG
jgi:hypothetical protein